MVRNYETIASSSSAVFLFAAVSAIIRSTKGSLNYPPAVTYPAAVSNGILKHRLAFSKLIGFYRGGLLP